MREAKGIPYLFRALGMALAALLLGTLVLLLTGVNVLRAWAEIFTGAFGSPSAWSWTLIGTAPLVLTALSAAFAHRAGLLNVGVEGQYIVGLMVAALAGMYVELPVVVHPLFCMAAAVVAAAAYGALTGYLKAAFGIHELFSGVLLTMIAFYGVNLWLDSSALLVEGDLTYTLQASASTVFLEQWPGMQDWISGIPVLSEMFATPVHWGMLLVCVLAPLVGFLLRRTAWAYEMHAVAQGPKAARQAGIPVRSRLVQAAAWAGGLAGLAAAVQLLGPTMPHQLSRFDMLPGYGISGLSAAYLGGFSVWGMLFAGVGFSALREGMVAADIPEAWYLFMVGLFLLLSALPQMERRLSFDLPDKMRKQLEAVRPVVPEKFKKRPNKVRK